MPESTPERTDDPLVAEVSAHVLSVLPFVYIAWADGILTPSEIEVVRTRLRQLDWLSDEDRRQLDAWLDPEQPPTASQYHSWIRTIQNAARRIPDASSRSLTDLGAAMADLAGNGTRADAGTRHALLDLEAELGIVGREAARDLIASRPAVPGEPPSGGLLDVGALTRILDGRHAALRDRIRTLLSDPEFTYVRDVNTTAYREVVFEWLKALARQGLGRLSYDASVGGEDDMEAFIVAFETLAYHDLSLVIKFGVQFGLFGGSIQLLGTERHHERYLPRVASAELPGCFAMSELSHGSNVRELETTATFDPSDDTFVVRTPTESARKEWIGNAARHGRMATVFARLIIDETDYGVHALLVPLRDDEGHVLPGIRIADCGEKMGLNGVDNGRIWFDDVRVPRANLLDRFATVDEDGHYASPIPSSSKRFFTMLGTLVGGRISIAAAALSAAKSGLTIAVRYGARRRQFGPKDAPERPLLDYRTHQRRLFPYLATAYGLHFAVADLARRFSEDGRSDETPRDIEVDAAGLKAFSSWNTTATLQEAREACGGQGYLIENRLPTLKADTDVFTTFEGDNTVLMLQVAKGLLSGYKQQFEDMNFFGVLRHLADEATTRLQELNPIIVRNTDPEHLRDPDFHRAAFDYRRQRLLQSVARRLKKRIEDGMDTYDAFVDVQDHMIRLAHAYVEDRILRRFARGVDAIDDQDLGQPLGHLRALFALSHMETHRGWFLERGYFESGKARAITREVNALCGALRPYATDLVDAFAIPDALLAAPIAVRPS